MFYCGAAHLATAAATCVLPVVLRCGAARLTAAACALPVVPPSGGCLSCCAVVLPVSSLPPPPACCLLCCCRAVACRAALWCCPHRRRHRCRLRAACRVAVGRLHVVSRCGAARLATTACALPAMSPSGGCVSCRAVVLP